MTTLPLAFQMPGLMEMVVIGIIGLLLFGKRLPDVGKSLAQGIMEFKKGLKGVENDIETGAEKSDARRLPADQQQALPQTSPVETPQQRFDPYTGRPLQPAYDPATGKPLA